MINLLSIVVSIVKSIVAFFIIIFLFGALSATIITWKAKQDNYVGPTTSSGAMFWLIGKVAKIQIKIKNFLNK